MYWTITEVKSMWVELSFGYPLKCSAKANTAFLDTLYFLISKMHQPTYEYWKYNSYTFTNQMVGDMELTSLLYTAN